MTKSVGDSTMPFNIVRFNALEGDGTRPLTFCI